MVMGAFFLWQSAYAAVTSPSTLGRALFFDPRENGIQLPQPTLDYEVMEDASSTIRIGPFLMNEKSFSLTGYFGNQLAEGLSQELGLSNSPDQFVFMFNWPWDLIPSGRIEMYSQQGSKILEFTLQENILTRLHEYNRKNSAVNHKSLDYYYVLNTNELSVLRKMKIFRYCVFAETRSDVTQEVIGHTRACSRSYGVKDAGSAGNQLGLIKPFGKRQALVNQKSVPYTGSIQMEAAANVHFYVESSTGMNYEFSSNVDPLVILDLAKTKSGDVEIVLSDVKPFAPYQIIKKPMISDFEKKFLISATLGDLRTFYRASVLKSQAAFYYPGKSGGVFKQDIDFNKVPPEAARLYLDEDNIKETYSASPTLHGRSDGGQKVKLSHHGTALGFKNANRFAWEFEAPLQGSYNRDQLNVEYEGKKYVAYQELYRGFANEFAMRGSGVVSSSGTIVMAEANYSHWFENVLGWHQSVLSTHRWGVNGRVFRSLKALPGNINYNFMTVDWKYRLSPGLWTRDETMGFMLNYVNLEFGNLKTALYGPGFFWARSMPMFLDDFLSYFPLLKQKKWLHMELQYYSVPMTKTVELRPTYTLNFQGQILWTPRFFGEAGLSYKRYDLEDVAVNKRMNLGLFFGTFGMGYKF